MDGKMSETMARAQPDGHFQLTFQHVLLCRPTRSRVCSVKAIMFSEWLNPSVPHIYSCVAAPGFGRRTLWASEEMHITTCISNDKFLLTLVCCYKIELAGQISNHVYQVRQNQFSHNLIFLKWDIPIVSGLGGLGVACWPLVPKFVGSNPAEAVGFLRAKKSSPRLPSEGK